MLYYDEKEALIRGYFNWLKENRPEITKRPSTKEVNTFLVYLICEDALNEDKIREKFAVETSRIVDERSSKRF